MATNGLDHHRHSCSAFLLFSRKQKEQRAVISEQNRNRNRNRKSFKSVCLLSPFSLKSLQNPHNKNALLVAMELLRYHRILLHLLLLLLLRPAPAAKIDGVNAMPMPRGCHQNCSVQMKPELNGTDEPLRQQTMAAAQISHHRCECSSSDISISQGQEGATHGIPGFVVEIVNTCYSTTISNASSTNLSITAGNEKGKKIRRRKKKKKKKKENANWQKQEQEMCSASQIHVHCGWFASAPLVNPELFRRVAFDDCLVNGGRPLPFGHILRFHYANSFMYPLHLKSVEFCT